jgi:hypothetical protein
VLVGMIAALRFSGAIDSSSLAPLPELVDTAPSLLTTEVSAHVEKIACWAS